MAWDIAVAGTLHRDDVSTPFGRRETYGGSAAYFALAACRYARVLLNGIVGADTVDHYRATFAGVDIDTQGMVVSERPTFVWHVVHDYERGQTASESAEAGCDPEWVPSLAGASRDAPVLFLASLRPELQRSVLRQSRARLVGADSMTVFMAERTAEVRAVAEGADVLFLNQRELAMVTGDHDWRRAARALCGRGRLRAVVVKQGRHGAACVSSNAVSEVAAPEVSPVLDPTGAGDALAGGFLGLCAREERDDAPFFEIALQEGVRCAARAIASFGVEGLLASA